MDQAYIRQFAQIPSVVSTRRHIYGQVITARQWRQSLALIAVLVSNKNGAQVTATHDQASQARLGSPHTEAAIHQQRACAPRHYLGITAAPTAKGRKLHSLSISTIYCWRTTGECY